MNTYIGKQIVYDQYLRTYAIAQLLLWVQSNNLTETKRVGVNVYAHTFRLSIIELYWNIIWNDDIC